jgi:hypothetical protein
MGKSARTKKAAERLKQKRAKKDAQRAKYQSFRDRGENSKRARRQARKTVRAVKSTLHTVADCGNTGCLKCNPVNFNPFLKDGKPTPEMPRWMFLMWQEA